MRAPDVEMVQTLTVMFVRTPLLIWALRRVERNASDAQLERAWAPATRDLSTVLIGSLGWLVHVLKFRRSWAGLAFGVVGMVGIEVVTALGLEGEDLLLQALFPGNR